MYNQLELRYNDLSSTKTSRKNGRRKSAFSDSDLDSTKESTSGTEDALLDTQFKDRCCKCRQYGHKGEDCLEKKSEYSTSSATRSMTVKFKRKCHYCRKKGHKEAECCKKKRDLESGNICKESGTTKEIMICRFCEDTRIYDVNSMYKLVDSLEARFKNMDQSEDAILEMIGQHFNSFVGLNAKGSKTDSDTE